MTALALSLTFVLAACSILYELIIAQTVSTFALNNVVWYSLTVGTFIGSMGLGAFLSPRLFRGLRLWERLLQIEVGLSLVGGLSVIAIHYGQAGAALLFTHGQMVAGDMVFFLSAFLAAAAIGVLTGAELPLLIELAESGEPGTDRAARVVAMDYFGSLAGALLFPVFFVPRLDMLAVSWLVALVNLAAAAVLAFRFRGEGGGNFGGFLTTFAGLFVALLLGGGAVQQYFLKMYYYYAYPVAELRRDVAHRQTPYQSVDIVRLGAERNSVVPSVIGAYSRKYARDPGLPRGFALYLNKDFQFYADVEEIYHETFAHVPVAVAGQVPRTVLIMGGGDGLLLREVLKYPGVERVVQVEIDRDIVRLFMSDLELQRMTAGAFRDPRLSLIIGDAYDYIRHTGELFDAVYLDFPAPADFSLSKLYSREFYALVRRHLSPGGFVVANTPGLMDDINQFEVRGRGEMKTWHVLSNTLQAAGFEEVRPFFALLEDDNPQALAILEREYRFSGGEKLEPEVLKENLREDLRSILDNITSGFIFARPVPGSVAPEFTDRGIALDVMNAKRYGLSIASHSQFRQESDPRAVNSILRPRLPGLSAWWKVRTPY